MALIRVSALLCREVEPLLPERPLQVHLWDDGAIGAGPADAPTFFVRGPAALAHFLRAPSSLGLGRAYTEGSLEVDDLDAAFVVVDTWEPPPLSAVDKARLGAALVLAAAPGGLPHRPSLELLLHGDLHTIERDAEAVRYHYDVGNEFFGLFLDESMTYSCAIFSRGARTLEEAQQAKLDLVCSKLALKEGERVLDVGCGWGSFVLHAAREYGVKAVGITLSEPQARLARERVAQAGLGGQVEIRVADYRELQGERYDAIASIGMVEHVGSNQIDVYARQLASLLDHGGRLLNHGIARLRHGVPEEAGAFTQRYVFPDGVPLQLSRVLLALERAGFVTEHVEGFAQDYRDTLTEWIRRLDANRERAERLIS